MNCAILLNHTPTKEQLQELYTDLGITKVLEPPEEIKEIWKQIPPGQEFPDAYIEPVTRWLQENLAPGDFLWVQGEPTAAFKVINEHPDLKAINATTRRVVLERQPDGSEERIRIVSFQHQGFREFSNYAEQSFRQSIQSKRTSSKEKKAVMLLNFSPMEEQIEELHGRFGVHDLIEAPKEIKELWKQIPPGKEFPIEHMKRIWAWLEKVSTPGDVLWVQGEITATYDLVSRFSALTPICATTRRESKDIEQSDGTRKEVLVQVHAGFRSYPQPPERHLKRRGIDIIERKDRLRE